MAKKLTFEEYEIKETLKCSDSTAKKIARKLYHYVVPDWSEVTSRKLKEDFLMVAEYENIKVK